jgi:hypothetical protein
LVLELGGDREEVLDDRCGEHARRQRTAVSVQPEQHDVAAADGGEQVDVVPRWLAPPQVIRHV